MADNDIHIFKLSHLAKLYKSRLSQLNARVPDRINSTRLKERLLLQLPHLKENHQGREILLGFDADIGAKNSTLMDHLTLNVSTIQ